MGDLLQVESCRQDGVTVVVVRGEIDAASAPLLQSTCDQVAADGHVVVDMSEVTFIDSSGLHVLLLLAMRLLDGDGVLQVRRPSSKVQRLFEVAGVTEVLLPEEAR